MEDPPKFAGFSGGKDSTAMVLRLAELGEDFKMIFTPAGRELPEVFRHINLIQKMTGREVVRPPGPSVEQLIDKYSALPNWRQRWCTRQVKIEPRQDYLEQFVELVEPEKEGDEPTRIEPILYIGLRHDEEERDGGRYYDVDYRCPLQEWGWGIDDVYDYLEEVGVEVPARTDCDYCYGQRLGEWHDLWKFHPDRYAHAEAREEETGHTFRSPGRDTWPAKLSELRQRFENGDRPRGAHTDEKQLQLFDCKNMQRCRVCSL